MLTKANMDSLREKRSIVDLIQHSLGGIIGSYQKGNLAATSRKDWITINKKNYFKSCNKKEVISQNPPRGGKKRGQ